MLKLYKKEVGSIAVVFLRPVFKLLIAVLVILLLVVIFQKKKWINGASLMFILVICSGVATLTLVATRYIADEYGVDGDSQSFFLSRYLRAVILPPQNSAKAKKLGGR